MADGRGLRVQLCGDLEIASRGRSLPAAVLPGRQGRIVFAFLVCTRDRPVRRDELANLLWPDQLPDSWTTSLSAIVSKLRRLLAAVDLDPAAVLASTPAGYQLVLPEETWVDWNVAQAAADDADAALAAGDHAGAVSTAADALSIAARGFLNDPCEWVDAQQSVARELCTRALLVTAEAHLLADAPGRAIEAAREVVDREPGREAGYRVLMRALAATGERAEAMRVWERCRATLADELGVDPSADTEAVYLQILGVAAQSPPSTAAELPSGVVTFLLTDIVESSGLWERDPTAMARALARHDELIAEIVALHGGTLLKTKLEGDATVSVFARATSGALGAIAVREALAVEHWQADTALTVRVALHTGEAFERAGDYFGPALNRAARLRALGSAGQILLSQATAELVVDHLPDGLALADRGHRDLRGLSRGENVFELTTATPETAGSVPAKAPGTRPPLPGALVADSPFVGRDEQLAAIDAAFEQARLGTSRAVLLAGEPGVGKTRLAAEWAQRAHDGGATVLYGRCEEDLGAPLQSFVECVRQLVPWLDVERVRKLHGIENVARIVPDLAFLIPGPIAAAGADPDGERSAMFDALARLLSDVAAERPLVFVIDDVHWAGRTTLLLLRHLLRGAENAPILVLATYRDTELGRTHPLADTIADLHRDGTADRITLHGLSADNVADYLQAVGHRDHALGDELARVTGGNPFFLIESLRHIDESGGGWEASTLPQGVREATGRRLSRLSDRTNDLLHVAAVVGTTFPLELVEQVIGDERVDEISEACAAGLVFEEVGASAQFRFAHALVRQVLLAELVTIKRIRLHRAIADLLEANSGADPDRHLADLARHRFECAAAGSDDAEKAVVACRRAADQALGRFAYAEAAELYGMAAQAHAGAEGSDEVAELLVARCEALLASGDTAPTRATLDELAVVGHGSRRWEAWHTTLAGQLAAVAEPDRLVELADGLNAAATALHDAGDLRGEAKAHFVRALACARLGRIGIAEQELDRALSVARSCGDHRLVNAVLAAAPEAAVWGPSPVARASGACLDVIRVLRITGGTPVVEAVALRSQAVLEALRGRTESAHTMLAAARGTVERLGLTLGRLETDVAAGHVALIDGIPAEAVSFLRPAFHALRERGLDADAARAAAMLGRAFLQEGRIEEAESVARESSRLGGADLRAGVMSRSVLALTASSTGDRDGALALAREAVDLAAATDALLLEVDARMALAGVLHDLGEDGAAAEETARAADLCERKGADALVARLRRESIRAGGDRVADTSPDAVRHVQDNLAAEYVRRATEALNAGDREAWLALHRADYRLSWLGLEEMEAPASRDYIAPIGRVITRCTTLATIGRYLVLGIVRSNLIKPPPVGPSWGEAQIDTCFVSDVDGQGRARRGAVFEIRQVGRAIAALLEWYAESTTGSDAERGETARRLFAAWLEKNVDRVVEDVLEFDLEHAVILVRGDGDVERVELDFAPEPAFANLAWRSIDRVATGTVELLGTRGDHHALVRRSVRGRGELALVAADDDGRLVASSEFPLDELDAAFVALRRGYTECRDPRLPQRMYATEDIHNEGGWEAARVLLKLAEDLIFEDHRLTGFGTLRSRDAFLGMRRSNEEQFRQARIRALHVREAAGASIAVVREAGSHDPVIADELVPFESIWVQVEEYDEWGEECRHWHIFDESQLAEALELFHALSEDRAEPEFANAAWEAFVRHSASRPAPLLVATRGDRLALVRDETADGERLVVVEIDDEGAVAPPEALDAGDVKAGLTVLEERFEAQRDPRVLARLETTDEWYNDRERPARFESLPLTEDFICEDHRLTGFGTLRSRAALLKSFRSIEDMLIDGTATTLHVRECSRARITATRMTGSVASEVVGAPVPFESFVFTIEVYDEWSTDCRHWHIFDESQLAEAFATYAALSEPPTSGV